MACKLCFPVASFPNMRSIAGGTSGAASLSPLCPWGHVGVLAFQRSAFPVLSHSGTLSCWRLHTVLLLQLFPGTCGARTRIQCPPWTTTAPGALMSCQRVTWSRAQHGAWRPWVLSVCFSVESLTREGRVGALWLDWRFR